VRESGRVLLLGLVRVACIVSGAFKLWASVVLTFGKFGWKNRMELPACVVDNIRNVLPKSSYKRFRHPFRKSIP
jgi:hypothetical protein